MIGYDAYPHIVESIARDVTDIPTLLALRATCHQLRQLVDTERFARHIVLKRGEATRFRDINISPLKRPELFDHTKIADLYGACKCQSSGPCICGGGSLADLACLARPSVELDFARIFTSTFRVCERREGALKARSTVYVVDVFPTGYCSVQLPLTPLPGIDFAARLPYLHHRYPTFPSKMEYEVFLIPSSPQPARASPIIAKGLCTSGIRFLSDLLDHLVYLFMRMDASLLLVGYERVPATLPSGTASSSKNYEAFVTADALEEEFNFLVKTSRDTPQERQTRLARLRCQRASEYAEAHGYETLEDMDMFHGL